MAKIFQYTSIDTLALILKNKNILFNRLDKVDDKEEAEFGSGKRDIKMGRYIFVSCWTKNHIEDSVMWKNYGDNYRGVRISMDENLFNSYKISNQFNAFFSEPYRVIEDCVLFLPNNEIKLYDVRYVDNNKERVAKLIKDETDYINIKVRDLGLYKNKSRWEYQKESRFRLLAYPLSSTYFNNNDNCNSYEEMSNIFMALMPSLIENKTIKPRSILIPLCVEALKSIEVTMGPLATKEDKEKVKDLLLDFYGFHYFFRKRIFNSTIREII